MRYCLPVGTAPWPGVKGLQFYDRIRTLVNVVVGMRSFWIGKAMIKHDVD